MNTTGQLRIGQPVRRLEDDAPLAGAGRYIDGLGPIQVAVPQRGRDGSAALDMPATPERVWRALHAASAFRA